MAFLIGAVVSRQDLLTKYTIMADIDLTGGFLVIGGVYAATFSSALASIVGAPQLLSSVARDELFGFLSYFKVTHKRDGFRFIKAPFVDGVSASFLRKLKWFVLAETLYSDDDSHGDALYVNIIHSYSNCFRVSRTNKYISSLEHTGTRAGRYFESYLSDVSMLIK